MKKNIFKKKLLSVVGRKRLLCLSQHDFNMMVAHALAGEIKKTEDSKTSIVDWDKFQKDIEEAYET